MLELLYTSNKTLTGTPGFAAYIKSWDALVVFIGGKLYKVFRDGTQCYLGDTYASWTKGNRVLGRLFYFNYDTLCWCYAADEIAGQVHADQVLNPNARVPCGSGSFIDEMAGLYLKTGSLVGQINPGFYVNNLAYAGSEQVLAVNHASGQVALVEYQTRKVLWTSTVQACVASAYDCRHHLIITIGSDHRVRLYLLDPVPATLAAPTLTPGARRLQGSLLRTRLTGGAGEPCPNYWVNWEITGFPSRGSLAKAVSKTDANGYAENYYYGPDQGEALGSETIQVTAVT